jgi:hypothetical protein
MKKQINNAEHVVMDVRARPSLDAGRADLCDDGS